MSILKKAGFKSVEDLPRTTLGFSSKASKDLPPQLKQAQVAYNVKETDGLCTMSKDSTTPPTFYAGVPESG